jgi:glutamyl-tRNA synthetase
MWKNLKNLFKHSKKTSAVRLRFAPSPTGFLHIGNLRSALFGYLIAKSLGGKFILRLEDTDQKREVAGAAKSLIDILTWAGIKFDEGPHLGGNFGPYIQTQRLGIYNELIKELLTKGQAYHCFCTSERLEEMREKQQTNKQAPRYDRTCRDLSAEEITRRITNGERYVIRQKMPLSGEVKVYDELRGEIKFKAEDLEDHVLIKSNGIPTYQFANIVDDHLMQITHVTRGDEWLPSFPKNILLYQAFGWTPPKYIHLPLILNKTGGKLSKRQGDVFVEDYRTKGYLPEAIVNFSALLGWHPQGDKEIFSLSELEKQFTIKGLGASPAVFDVEKLDYYNGYYIRQKPLDELVELCRPYLTNNLKMATTDRQHLDYLKKVVSLEQERLKKLSDIEEVTKLFFTEDIQLDPQLLIWKQLTMEAVKNNLQSLRRELEGIALEDWTKEGLEKAIVGYIKAKNQKVGDYLWPLRVALTGQKNSPSPFEVAWALGKAISLNRLQKALDKI